MGKMDYLDAFTNLVTKTKGIRDILDVISIIADDDRYLIDNYPDLFTLLFMAENELAENLNDLSDKIYDEYVKMNWTDN